jgi:MFS family permease
MKNKKTILLVIIYIISILFSAIFEVDESEKIYTESMASVCLPVIKNIESKFSSGIKLPILRDIFAKSRLVIIENLKKVVSDLKLEKINEDIEYINLELIHKSGSSVITTNKNINIADDLKNILKEKRNKNTSKDLLYFLDENSRYCFFYKITNINADYYVGVSVDKKIFRDAKAREQYKFFSNLIILFIFGTLILIIVLNLFFYKEIGINGKVKMNFLAFSFIFISFSNFLLFFSSTNKMKNIYLNGNTIHSEIISDSSYKIEEFENINQIQTQIGRNKNYILPGFEEENDSIGNQFKKILSNDKMLNILVNFAIKYIISILFLVEILFFYKFFFDKKNSISVLKIDRSDNDKYKYMRTGAFLILFGIDLSISFIPIYAKSLYFPFLDLSEKTLIGLPITFEFIFVGISIFFAGIWSDRKGWPKPFLSGAFFASIGSIGCYLVNDFLLFTMLRGIVGFGYGLMLLSSQIFIVSNSNLQNRTFAIAQFISGIYAGSICGAATGAILADNIGYKNVFLIGGVIILSIIPYYYIVLKNSDNKQNLCYKNWINDYKNKWVPLKKEKNKSLLKFKKLTSKDKLIEKITVFKFIKNRIVIALILFSSFPAAIGTVGFLNYFVPIYLEEMGISQSVIGSVFIVYGLSLVFIGPTLSKFADKTNNKKYFIFIGCTLASVTFMLFYFENGLGITLIAALLLGISTSLVIASQSSFLLGLEITKKFGEGKALGIFRATSRAGQAAGPIMFSFIFFGENINYNMAFIGLIYLLSSFIFLAISKNNEKIIIRE